MTKTMTTTTFKGGLFLLGAMRLQIHLLSQGLTEIARQTAYYWLFGLAFLTLGIHHAVMQGVRGQFYLQGRPLLVGSHEAANPSFEPGPHRDCKENGILLVIWSGISHTGNTPCSHAGDTRAVPCKCITCRGNKFCQQFNPPIIKPLK